MKNNEETKDEEHFVDNTIKNLSQELSFFKKRWEISRNENEQLKKEIGVIKKMLTVSKKYVKSSINKEIEIIRKEQNLSESKCELSSKNIENLMNILQIQRD